MSKFTRNMTTATWNKITLSVDADIWTQFRIACLEHNLSASQAITALIMQQLNLWTQPQKETTP